MSQPATYTCSEVVELVTEYLEGGLAADARLGFERHVMLCPPCRGYLAQLRRILAAAPALRDEDLPASLRAQLLDAFADWKSAT